MKIQRRIPLKPLNTMALPAMADYFCEAESVTEVQQAQAFAREQALPLVVLGGGSNVIFSGDVSGLVLHIANKGIELLERDDSSVRVRVQAGEIWDEFLQHCQQQQWYGLENLAIIPGTVGAAPVQNIGAYGQEVADCIDAVHGVDADGELITLQAPSCAFAYRDSIFKQALKGRFIITAVDFRLHRQFLANIGYQPLADALSGFSNPDAGQVREAVIAIRNSKLPAPQQLANSGSFFKNPLVSAEQYRALQRQFSALPGFRQADGRYKLAAGWLIEQAGWKGRSLGPVGMFDKQALVMVNHGGARYADIQALTQQICEDVEQMFAVRLEQEPVQVDAGVTV